MTMTAVAEDTTVVETEEKSEGTRGRTKDRDFTKFTKLHQELADFINANSGLDPVTPNQVKAVIALRTDFNDTPEQRAKREEAKKRREAEAEKYKGMTQEEIKAEKAAQRAERQAAKLQARLQEALDKAKRIREGKDATGADLVAEVEAQQNGADTGEKKRTISRKK